jgi:hypothetical protein
MKRLLGGFGLLVVVVTSLAAAQHPTRRRANVAQRQAVTAAGDKWKVTTRRNPLDDVPIVTATLDAERPIQGWMRSGIPTLVVRCQTPPPADPLIRIAQRLAVQPGLDVYVLTRMPPTVGNPERQHSIRVQFDDKPHMIWASGEATTDDSLFIAPVWATKMILTDRLLAQSRRMLLEFAPFNSSPVIITFDVRGFEQHEKQVLAACPSLDQTQWSFPRAYGTRTDPNVRSLTGATEEEVRAKCGEPRQAVELSTGLQWTYSTQDGDDVVLFFMDGTVSDVRNGDTPLRLIKANTQQPTRSRKLNVRARTSRRTMLTLISLDQGGRSNGREMRSSNRRSTGRIKHNRSA